MSQFLAISSCNANVEQSFSLKQAQWTKERNMLNVELLRGAFIPTVKFQRNFLQRFPYLPEEQCTVTKKIRFTQKDEWAYDQEYD
jgi:hypothetical protein